MQLNSFVLRLAVLLLPGLLGSKIYRKLRGKSEKETWEDFAEILIFSIVSYLIYSGLAHYFQSITPSLSAPTTTPSTSPTAELSKTALQNFIDERAPLDLLAIVGASVVALFLAFFASAIATRQWVNKFGFWTRSTRRQGDAAVWTIFNVNYAPPSQYQWAYVRDSKANVVYFGVIRHFSDPGPLHELVMHDVSVFKSDSWESLYELSVLYVAREAGELSIEFPARATGDTIEVIQ